MRYLLITSIIFLAVTNYEAQNSEPNSAKAKNANIYTPLKPADGQPAIFGSQEELNASVPTKKKHAMMVIDKMAFDTAIVKSLRWELWRLDNAIVLKPRNEKKNDTK